MRIPTRLTRGPLEFNMTPMIDIVFLLIIFFLVSSHLVKQEVQLELDLPSAESGRQDEETGVRRIVVNVRHDGTILLSGRSVTADELGTRVGYEKSHAQGPIEVYVRSDHNVPFGVVQPIMLACVRNGVWNVTFAVVRARDKPK